MASPHGVSHAFWRLTSRMSQCGLMRLPHAGNYKGVKRLAYCKACCKLVFFPRAVPVTMALRP